MHNAGFYKVLLSQKDCPHDNEITQKFMERNAWKYVYNIFI